MSDSNAVDHKTDHPRATTPARGEPRLTTGIDTLIAGAMLVLSMSANVSCTAVPAFKQQRLAKANMVFDDSNAFAFGTRLQPQSEPGSASSGGAQGGGCTACK
jgi:hypothetical protein